MAMTDSIADMLTRIRNATVAHREYADIPGSKMKLAITRILKEEGYIRFYKYLSNDRQGIIRIYLKYVGEKESAIHSLNRISKPGCRRYVSKDKIPYVLGGLGIAIISTSKGLLTDKKCRQLRVGGEHICNIW